ncbi:MAG: hypothetical protein K2X27_12885 [Candidatus Obscuribacterales bacterium]|nr:hypothetical protein [Candidatus Obscuribacterales bacterium]
MALPNNFLALTAALLLGFTAEAVFADETAAPGSLPANFAAEASGSGSGTSVFRIKRDYSPKLYGAIEKSKILPQPEPYGSMEPSLGSAVQANDYAAAVTTLSSPPPQSKTLGNYLWGQSSAGGYYDASGQIKETVRGDELYKFGGKFMDGTAVPTTPVVCNFRGHVYKPYVVKRVGQ